MNTTTTHPDTLLDACPDCCTCPACLAEAEAEEQMAVDTIHDHRAASTSAAIAYHTAHEDAATLLGLSGRAEQHRRERLRREQRARL